MGNCKSGDGWPKEAERDPKYKYSYDCRQRPKKEIQHNPDREYYRATNLRDTMWVRGPGTVTAAGVSIDNCENVDFFVCDACDSVLIDDVKNCRFFLGPASGSVMIRTAKNCQFVVACGQLRTRDCTDCTLLLYTNSQPVIESSRRLVFGCFDYFYFSLQEQLDVGQLSVFNNQWSDIHDFTPQSCNFSWSDPGMRGGDLLKPLHEAVPDIFTQLENTTENECPVPRTWGDRDLPAGGEHSFALFFPGQHERCIAFLGQLKKAHPELLVVRTRELVWDVETAKRVLAESEVDPAWRTLLLQGPLIGISVYGPDANSVVHSLLSDSSGILVPATEQEAKYLGDHFFRRVRT